MTHKQPIVFIFLLAGLAQAQLAVKSTDNLTRMYITADGRVGINTTAPTSGAILDVNGKVKMSVFQLGTAAQPNYVLTSDGAGIGSWQGIGNFTPVWSASINNESYEIFGRQGDENDPHYASSSVYRYIVSGSDYDWRFRIENPIAAGANNAKLSISANHGLARLRIKSADTPLNPVEICALPFGTITTMVDNSDYRLYTNAGFVTDGDNSLFVHNLITKTVNIGTTALPLPVNNPRLHVYGKATFVGYVSSPNLEVGNPLNYALRFYNGKLVKTERSSSIRFKEQVKTLERDFNSLFKVRPIEFTYKGNTNVTFGLAAEELASAGLTDLVLVDENGRPDGVEYEKLSVYLLEIVKQQRKRIARLEKMLE